MKSKNLVICDGEEGFADAFARYLLKKEELAFQVQTCSELSYIQSVGEKIKIDYLFLSSVYPPERRKEVEAGKIFLLVGDEEVQINDGEIPVYKYQSGEEILAELIQACGQEESAEGTFLRAVRKKEGKIIGVYSPVHRVGKTAYALELGEKLAEEANVLYLNMELYGGREGHFEEGGLNISDILYYIRQEQSNLGLILTTVVKHRGSLDYVSPAQVSEDIRTVKAEEWLGMMQRIMEESIYEVLILDLDDGLSGLYGILGICTEIHVLTLPDGFSQSKIRQFEEELTLLGHEDVRGRLVQKEQKL